MKQLTLFSVLLLSLNTFSQESLHDKNDRLKIYSRHISLGYINSTNHWTKQDKSLSSSGHSSRGASIEESRQTGHGFAAEFEVKFKHLGLITGINITKWFDNLHGITGTSYHHPHAPAGYPLINHYSTETSIYEATANEFRAKLGIEYWVFSTNKSFNFGVCLASNPRLSTRQNVLNERSDYYFIHEVGAWMSNPGFKDESSSSSNDTQVTENGLNEGTGFTGNSLRRLNLSYGLLLSARLNSDISFEAIFGMRYQRNSRINYHYYQQDAGFFGQIMLSFEL
ncbi:MAG: hypothetical protein COA38_02420 [Fluviicola sp.]|nr:MAG: hypothetical protein COA38_02420 [Fluviicola sp.]